MALCSPTFPSTSAVVAGAATKRGCSTFNSLYTTPNKRICLNNKISAFGGIGFKGFYNSSLSSEEEDSESDSDNGAQSPFEAIQVRRKLIPTRKSSVVLAVTGSETAIAVQFIILIVKTMVIVIITILFLLLTGMLELVALNI